MNKILGSVYGFAASFFGMAAIGEFVHGDPVTFALYGLLCYYSISQFEDAWKGWNE